MREERDVVAPVAKRRHADRKRGEPVVEVLAERLLLDGVGQVAVVGVEHPDWGEAVVAYVVPADGATIDPKALMDGARTSLARYELPKVVVPIDSLPLTSIGKVDKKKLRESWTGWDL